MNRKCWECGEEWSPAVSLRSPPAYDEKIPTKHFCCVACFWKYLDRIIKDRDGAKRLDIGINWDTKP